VGKVLSYDFRDGEDRSSMHRNFPLAGFGNWGRMLAEFSIEVVGRNRVSAWVEGFERLEGFFASFFPDASSRNHLKR